MSEIMTGHFEKGVWIEDAPKIKYSTPDDVWDRHTRNIGSMNINVSFKVDDHELRDAIARLKVYAKLRVKMKPKAGWFLRQLRKIGVVDEMYDYEV